MAMLMHGGVNYSGTTGSSTITLTQAEYDLLPVEEQMDPEKVYYITDGVQTSTTIVPNPTTQATQELTKLQINETIYELSGGSEVEPNPEDDPTDTLEKLEIDGTVYELAGSGTGIVLLPSIYSTKEKAVGIWTDGKPLYQKTYIVSSVTSQRVELDTITDIDRLVDFHGTFNRYINDVTTKYVIDGRTESATYNDYGCTWGQASDGVLSINFYGYSYTEITSIAATVLYTKTSDQPVGQYDLSMFGIFAPSIYSETEREVGVWTDGKPLYQKTWVESINANSRVQLLTNIENETTIGLAYYDGTNWIDPFYTDNTTNIGCGFTQLVSNVLYFVNNMASNLTWRFTIRYTKTTDVAGSGSYTDIGTPAIHYDNSERVIGTWFDKPLYSRAYSITATSAWTSGATKIATLDATWTITRIDSVVKENNAQYSMPYVNGMGSIRLEVDNGTDLNMVVSGTSYAAGSVAQIIIEYTKTTD